MRRITLFTLVALLALGTGCGTSEKETAKGGRATGKAKAAKKRPGERLREAVARTRRTSVRVEETITVRRGTEESILTIKGPFDFARDRGELSVALPGDGRLKEIFDGGEVFLSPVRGLPRATWGAVERDRAEKHAPIRAPLNDPEYVLEQISQLHKVRYYGSAGTRAAYEYTGWLDFDTYLHRLDPKSDAMLKKPGPDGSERFVQARVLVDKGGLLSRIDISALEMDLEISLAIDFSHHGTPVTVTPPKTTAALSPRTYTGPLQG
ncbi:hypothetical protein [Streptomyces cucumeris]|uniref:hypothetical protein n=1 Tax=Streptomyces cucumeris TaxID=2962890 RepID=UPI003D744B7D